jgi:hypothetical protein
VYRFVLPTLAAAALALPANAVEPKEELDQTLTKAKKEKKYVAVVFLLSN